MMNKRPSKKAKKPEAARGPFRNLRQGMMNVLDSKTFLLVMSLLIAVFAWGVLVASDGSLVRQKVFPQVAVNVTGESTLKSRGYIVMDEISNMVPGVRMVVEVAQMNYDRVTGTSYNPHFDLSKITGAGEAELQIGFSSQLYGPVVSCEPSSVTVKVERYITRRVPVVLELVGETERGVYLDSSRTEPSMLSVSGPQSLVSQVARASVQLDVSALTLDRGSDRTALPITLQNSKGEPIQSDKLEVTNQTVLTDAVIVETEVVPEKEIPLELSAFVTGKPAEGYELLGVVTDMETLGVAAREDVLDTIEFITTDQPLDITGADQDVSGYVRIKRPSNTENTLPAEVSITAQIAEETIERTMRGVAVEIDGVGAGLAASLAAREITVQLTGGYAFITALERDDVRLFVDASGLAAGSHLLPVQIRIDNAEPFTCALSEPEITLKIVEDQE